MMRPSDTATLAMPASRWLPAEELSVAGAGQPPQDRRFSALRHPNLSGSLLGIPRGLGPSLCCPGASGILHFS